MELAELTSKTLKIFEISEVDDLSEAIMNSVFENRQKLKLFKELVRNLEIDWLQKIWQYYSADRDNLKQDYTPTSLAKLVSRLTETKNSLVVLDLCSGSGALTIQKWTTNKNLKFICKEYDEKVIPILLFNLALRNIEGYVVQTDVLNLGFDKQVYRLTTGEEFSKVEKVEKVELEADICISNPPFNLRWERPVFAKSDLRFAYFGVPPKSNANFGFVLTGLYDAKEKASFILPSGVLTSSEEFDIRKKLIESNLVESVIINPDKMFTSTQIGTCILTLNKTKDTSTIRLIDGRNYYTEETREQKGQYGGASHTNRVYKKVFKTYSDSQIDEIVNSTQDKDGFCRIVDLQEVKKNEYILSPSRYIELKEPEDTSRSYQDIVKDFNRVTTEKNKLKLTINETLARQLGFDIELYKGDKDSNFAWIENFSGQKVIKDNYITFSKRKNEMKFENQSGDESPSHILLMILKSWKEFIYFQNMEQNRYLSELRDKLLPDLMSGKIDPDNFAENGK